ncbi:urease subunit beta [Paraclostridium sordellii]|uniref:urease subunit beta n=1 Tax=Paraclostridium sordellii TaxID=1505 RepID=UPI0030CB1E16
MIPGEIITRDREIVLNKDKKTLTIKVENAGDRPIQVGSHFHFFEVNKLLKFNRKSSFGMRLNIPSGTSIRFEPGERKEVDLVELGGNKKAFGFNGLTEGQVNDDNLKKALEFESFKYFL